MTSSPLRTVSAVVLAAFLVTAPAAQALPLSGEASVLGRIWSLVADLWSKNGCVIEPNGYCLPGISEDDPTIENGCVIDPSGQCTTTAKNGCRIDPDGVCRP